MGFRAWLDKKVTPPPPLLSTTHHHSTQTLTLTPSTSILTPNHDIGPAYQCAVCSTGALSAKLTHLQHA